MHSIPTVPYHGNAVEYSPYHGHRLACASGQNYGIAGDGKLFVFDLFETGPVCIQSFHWKDALFDTSWSENNENVLVAGSGDGCLLVWDVKHSQDPVRVLQEHQKEIYGVDWSQTRDIQLVISASWDTTIKLWDIHHPSSLSTFTGHNHIVYCAIWSPHLPGCFATVSGDQTLRIWDIKKPNMSQIVIPAHNEEVLSVDWSKYNKNIVITGSVDCTMKVWDLRKPSSSVYELRGHDYAIRRLKCSPFKGDIIASCSYDKTVRLWNYNLQPSPLQTMKHHNEFVCGLDFNMHNPSQIADCAWDSAIKIYTPGCLQ